jgi:hypothetical protein
MVDRAFEHELLAVVVAEEAPQHGRRVHEDAEKHHEREAPEVGHPYQRRERRVGIKDLLCFAGRIFVTEALTDLARRFRFNEHLLGMVTEGFGDADWSATPTGQGGNTPHWIVGHLAASRRALLRMIGGDADVGAWEERFAMSAKPTGTQGYPAPSVLSVDFAAHGELLEQRLASLTAEEAATAWGGKLPDGSTTYAGAAGFLYMHECYHLGQVGLLRRIRGHTGFA